MRGVVKPGVEAKVEELCGGQWLRPPVNVCAGSLGGLGEVAMGVLGYGRRYADRNGREWMAVDVGGEQRRRSDGARMGSTGTDSSTCAEHTLCKRRERRQRAPQRWQTAQRWDGALDTVLHFGGFAAPEPLAHWRAASNTHGAGGASQRTREKQRGITTISAQRMPAAHDVRRPPRCAALAARSSKAASARAGQMASTTHNDAGRRVACVRALPAGPFHHVGPRRLGQAASLRQLHPSPSFGRWHEPHPLPRTSQLLSSQR
ncbi:hypothetical protein PSPO01_13201 [Paraphaeosphaeria sporulosa]